MSTKTMTVEEILNAAREQGSDSTKTAATEEKPTPPVALDRLVSAVGDLLSGSTKTAGEKTAEEEPAGEPTDVRETLLKFASEIAGAETANNIKEAQLYGAAFTDGMMMRAVEWNQAAGLTGTPEGEKTAEDHAFEKFAAENPDAVKQAATEGYNAVTQGLEAYKQGSAQMEEYAKVAEAVYIKGYRDMSRVVEKLAQAQK